MALTYEKVIGVISQPPDMRKDFEVSNLLSWFRKKSDLFRNLKTELLFDIIKHLQLETKKRDDIVIKQGELGDCMYILLRGQVTIYILYAAKVESEDDKPQQPLVQLKAGESVRTQLGTFVCNLGAGATFGEVALFSDDCIRTASIISDDNADLIVVDRELYNRSVKSVLQKEFEDKSNFIATSPYFHNWPPKYKKQLAMALVKDSVPYENVLVKQGDPVSGIYFILSGEVKLLSDPSQHDNQYQQKFGRLPEVKLPPEEEHNEVNELLKQMSVKGHRPDEPTLPKYRRKQRKNVLELCLLGMNECVGDVEVLLDMETYMQTAVCTQRTEVLLLEMKHFERLLVKRNPRTIDSMKAGLELKLTSRISSHIARQVPLLKVLGDKVLEFIEQREQANIARSKGKDLKNNKTGKKHGAYNGFIPNKGPLIDMHGPGTVFHHIRKRQQAKVKQNAAGSSRFPAPVPSGPGAGSRGSVTPAVSVTAASGAGSGSAKDLDPTQIDPVLDNLERRMRDWLVNEKGAKGRIQPKYQIYDMKTGVREKPKSGCSPPKPAQSRASKVQSAPVRNTQTVTKKSLQPGGLLKPLSSTSNMSDVSSVASSEDRPRFTHDKNEVYNGSAFV